MSFLPDSSRSVFTVTGALHGWRSEAVDGTLVQRREFVPVSYRPDDPFSIFLIAVHPSGVMPMISVATPVVL